MKLCIIPARGGSKRIKRKNIRDFCGKPIIAWSIEAAIRSKCFDEIIVSTDDREIADVAREYGASVPFRRPADLSGDHAATLPVIRHAISWLENVGTQPEAVCCLYPTAPTVSTADISAGCRILSEASGEFVISITSYAYPIQRALRITELGKVEMLNPRMFNSRSQDLEATWHDAGQFYWGTAKAWSNYETVFGPHSVPLFIPHYRVQDIDTLDDWKRAEAIFMALQSLS